jgi:hypothetical protein
MTQPFGTIACHSCQRTSGWPCRFNRPNPSTDMREIPMDGENTAPADELAFTREQIRVPQRREAELRAVMLSDPSSRVVSASWSA